MRRPQPVRAMTVVLVAIAMTAGGEACSGDRTACEAVESLQRAADQVRAIDVGDESVMGLSGALLDLSLAAEDAAEAGASREDVDALNDDLAELQRALGPVAEGESESSTALAAVEPQVASALTGIDELLADISHKC